MGYVVNLGLKVMQLESGLTKDHRRIPTKMRILNSLIGEPCYSWWKSIKWAPSSYASVSESGLAVVSSGVWLSIIITWPVWAPSLEDETRVWVGIIVNGPSEEETRHQIDRVTDWLEKHDAKRASMKWHEEKDDLLARMRFPKEHRKRLRTINNVERLNREADRRLGAVGVFPDRKSMIRPGGSYLMQQHKSWIRGRRYKT